MKNNHDNLPPLPRAAEGHVARRYPHARHLPPTTTTEPTRDEKIDEYCGPVWVGGACFLVLGGIFFGSAIVAVFRWLGEVIK